MHFKGIKKNRLFTLFKSNVDNRTDNLYHVSFVHIFFYSLCKLYLSALAPEVTSAISWVMAACRALLNNNTRLSLRDLALSEALFIATIRAECSEAFASSIV